MPEERKVMIVTLGGRPSARINAYLQREGVSPVYVDPFAMPHDPQGIERVYVNFDPQFRSPDALKRYEHLTFTRFVWTHSGELANLEPVPIEELGKDLRE